MLDEKIDCDVKEGDLLKPEVKPGGEPKSNTEATEKQMKPDTRPAKETKNPSDGTEEGVRKPEVKLDDEPRSTSDAIGNVLIQSEANSDQELKSISDATEKSMMKPETKPKKEPKRTLYATQEGLKKLGVKQDEVHKITSGATEEHLMKFDAKPDAKPTSNKDVTEEDLVEPENKSDAPTSTANNTVEGTSEEGWENPEVNLYEELSWIKPLAKSEEEPNQSTYETTHPIHHNKEGRVPDQQENPGTFKVSIHLKETAFSNDKTLLSSHRESYTEVLYIFFPLRLMKLNTMKSLQIHQMLQKNV